MDRTKFVARYPAKLLRTLHRFSTNAHKIPFIEVSQIGRSRGKSGLEAFRERARRLRVRLDR